MTRLTMEQRILASQLWERAKKRDREAADWLARTKVQGETVPEIEADVGQPVARIYERVARLMESLNPQLRKNKPAPRRRKRRRRAAKRRPRGASADRRARRRSALRGSGNR